MTILPLRDSPPEVREQRRYTGRRVREIILSARNVPTVTEWEAGFLADLEEKLSRYHGYLEVSERQAEVLLRIEDKTEIHRLGGTPGDVIAFASLDIETTIQEQADHGSPLSEMLASGCLWRLLMAARAAGRQWITLSEDGFEREMTGFLRDLDDQKNAAGDSAILQELRTLLRPHCSAPTFTAGYRAAKAA